MISLFALRPMFRQTMAMIEADYRADEGIDDDETLDRMEVNILRRFVLECFRRQQMGAGHVLH